MSTSLRVVNNHPPAGALVPTAESLSEQILRLQAQARDLAREHVEGLVASLLDTQRMAETIALGGEAYPAGVRDIARHVAQENGAKALMLEALSARVYGGVSAS